MDEIDVLINGARGLGIEMSLRQKEQFQGYYHLLREWNQKINLVSLRGSEELFRSHFLDSLWCSRGYDLQPPMRVLDLGSGAGFPGLPIKICYPQLDMVLLEARRKKCLFLQEAIRVLGLKNCQVIHGRAEEFGHLPEYREKIQCVVARALAAIPVLVELSLPFLELQGCLAALKGRAVEEEINASRAVIKMLGGELDQVIPYRLDDEEGRHLVVIKKTKSTPLIYPRRAGIPAKRPLSK